MIDHRRADLPKWVDGFPSPQKKPGQRPGFSFANHETRFRIRPMLPSVTALEPRPARGAFGSGFRLVDLDVATFHVGAIEALDRRIGLRIVVHLNEAEAFRFTAGLVSNQVDLGDFTETGKGLAQIRIGNAIRKIAYVDVHSCLSLKI